MIIDVRKFLETESPHWRELESFLDRMEKDPVSRMDLAEVQRFHLLYRRASTDLGRISHIGAEQQTRHYLENLVARAYEEIHETRGKSRHFDLQRWFFATLPSTFRRHIRSFWISLAATMIGFLFGGFALGLDAEAKHVLMPFSHLQQDPAHRVHEEERQVEDPMEGNKEYFSSYLMTHNTRVSIFTLALGMTFGVGTIIMLFYNGVILGAVALDYMIAGQTVFLLGWLLPHGVIEIPAILMAGQAGCLIGGTLIGWGSRVPLGARLRSIAPDLVTLIAGVALMLIWAGFVEAFLSQYHEPRIPYGAKIAFGVVEFAMLVGFLGFSGKRNATDEPR